MKQSTVREIALAYGISQNHVAKLAHELMKKGYLKGQKGRGGGIRLAIDPAEIRIGELIEEMERPNPLLECFDSKTNTCPIIGICNLQTALDKAQTSFYQSLNELSLEDILNNPTPRDPRLSKLGIK